MIRALTPKPPLNRDYGPEGPSQSLSPAKSQQDWIFWASNYAQLTSCHKGQHSRFQKQTHISFYHSLLKTSNIFHTYPETINNQLHTYPEPFQSTPEKQTSNKSFTSFSQHRNRGSEDTDTLRHPVQFGENAAQTQIIIFVRYAHSVIIVIWTLFSWNISWHNDIITTNTCKILHLTAFWSPFRQKSLPNCVLELNTKT